MEKVKPQKKKKLENRYIFIASWVGENLGIKETLQQKTDLAALTMKNISVRNIIKNMGKNHEQIVLREDIYMTIKH